MPVYRHYSETDNPDHPVIKELTKKGFENIDLRYTSKGDPYRGWQLIKSNKLNGQFLGLTMDEAIEFVKEKLDEKL